MDLKSYLEEYGISPAVFARKSNISRTYVHKLKKGEGIPSKYAKKRIEIASEGHVGMDDWRKKGDNP